MMGALICFGEDVMLQQEVGFLLQEGGSPFSRHPASYVSSLPSAHAPFWKDVSFGT
jgi:hypothetical protein